jgi:hypothetical protein
MSGWIKLHRQIRNHWVFKNANYFKAWVAIISEVNHKSTKVIIEGELIECKRGQSINSLATWVRILGDEWTIQKLRTFLKLLEKDKMINTEGLRKTTRLTVCNYESYQSEQQGDNKQTTRKQQGDNKEITTNKNEKKEKNEKEVLLDEWISYRNEIKKVLTDASIQKLKNKMALYSDEKCKFVINTSISNGWQGLFWDKYTEQPKQQTIISDFVYKDESNMTDEELWAYAKEKMEHRKKEIAIYG